MQRFVEGKWNTSHSFATSEQRAQVALKLEELFRSVDLDGPRIDELIFQTLTNFDFRIFLTQILVSMFGSAFFGQAILVFSDLALNLSREKKGKK